MKKKAPNIIDSEGAIAIARARAQERGWPFAEPLAIVHRRGWFGLSDLYDIETSAGMRGTKARFTIDAATGTIVSEGYIPR